MGLTEGFPLVSPTEILKKYMKDGIQRTFTLVKRSPGEIVLTKWPLGFVSDDTMYNWLFADEISFKSITLGKPKAYFDVKGDFIEFDSRYLHTVRRWRNSLTQNEQRLVEYAFKNYENASDNTKLVFRLDQICEIDFKFLSDLILSNSLSVENAVKLLESKKVLLWNLGNSISRVYEHLSLIPSCILSTFRLCLRIPKLADENIEPLLELLTLENARFEEITLIYDINSRLTPNKMILERIQTDWRPVLKWITLTWEDTRFVDDLLDALSLCPKIQSIQLYLKNGIDMRKIDRIKTRIHLATNKTLWGKKANRKFKPIKG